MMARVLASLLLLAAAATTTSASCPHGWTDGSQHGMGCLLFNHTRDRQAFILWFSSFCAQIFFQSLFSIVKFEYP